jgi:hypothetical protein
VSWFAGWATDSPALKHLHVASDVFEDVPDDVILSTQLLAHVESLQWVSPSTESPARPLLARPDLSTRLLFLTLALSPAWSSTYEHLIGLAELRCLVGFTVRAAYSDGYEMLSAVVETVATLTGLRALTIHLPTSFRGFTCDLNPQSVRCLHSLVSLEELRIIGMSPVDDGDWYRVSDSDWQLAINNLPRLRLLSLDAARFPQVGSLLLQQPSSCCPALRSLHLVMDESTTPHLLQKLVRYTAAGRQPPSESSQHAPPVQSVGDTLERLVLSIPECNPVTSSTERDLDTLFDRFGSSLLDHDSVEVDTIEYRWRRKHGILVDDADITTHYLQATRY